MVYGAILEKEKQFYTYLSQVFNAIERVQTEYNWLITDCDAFPISLDINELLFSHKYCWLSGEELTALIDKEDFQWIWAVLSGFDKNIPLETILQYPLPYADGYEGFWKNPLSIQHPLASVEIAPLDSSLVLIFSKHKRIVDSFLKNLPLSEDLSLLNESLI